MNSALIARRNSIRTSVETLSQKLGVEETAKGYKKVLSRKYKKSRKRVVRYGLLSINAVLLVAAIGFVTSSNEAPKTVQQNSLSGVAEAEINPLDQLSSADIAVHVARMTGIEEAVAVVNRADSVNALMETASSDNTIVAKPQVVSTDLRSRHDIKKYVSQQGDTVSSLASKFGVTSETIRWSNGLTEETIPAGKELWISPVNGVIYKVKPGDTPDSLAQRYRANKEQIIAFNDAEIGGLPVGERIVIPDGRQPAPIFQRTSYYGGFSASYGGNGYDYGWCTWHAANRRNQIGKPIPNNLGNAITWASRARMAGMSVGTTPAAGAVLYHRNIGGLGHVAFVERINSDGSILVSDMNFPYWGRVTNRTVSQSEFGSYYFIY